VLASDPERRGACELPVRSSCAGPRSFSTEWVVWVIVSGDGHLLGLAGQVPVFASVELLAQLDRR
jgi:hypothetical protein